MSQFGICARITKVDIYLFFVNMSPVGFRIWRRDPITERRILLYGGEFFEEHQLPKYIIVAIDRGDAEKILKIL